MAEERDLAEFLNRDPEGWVAANSLTFTVATPSRVEAEVQLGPEHLQAYGIVHGGVHSGIIETLASVGAALYALERGQPVVGLENHTTFVHAARSPGRLFASATPITRGRRTQVWEGVVRDADQRVLATGRVRLLCLEPGSELAGGAVAAVPLK